MKSDNDESKPPKKPSPPSSESGTPPTPDDDEQETSSSEEDLRNILRELAEADSDTQIKASLKYFSYTGVWPPAEILREQEEAHAGAGERLLKWTEDQTSHRQALERLKVEGMERRMDKGQWIGLGIAGACIVMGSQIIIQTNSWPGAIAAAIFVAVGVGGPTAGRVIAKAIFDKLSRREDS